MIDKIDMKVAIEKMRNQLMASIENALISGIAVPYDPASGRVDLVENTITFDLGKERPTLDGLDSRDLELVRQWFDAVQDVNPEYLEAEDFALAKKVYGRLNLRVPRSVIEGLTKNKKPR